MIYLKDLLESNIQKLKKIETIEINVDEINSAIVEFVNKAYKESTDGDAKVECNTDFSLKDDRYIAVINLVINTMKSKIIGDVNISKSGLELSFTYKIKSDSHFFKKSFKFIE